MKSKIIKPELKNLKLYLKGREANIERLDSSNTGFFGGRFMPFHMGHYQALELISKIYDHVHIGIVNPNPKNWKGAKKEKFALYNNPFTYEQRVEMIEKALETMGIEATIKPYFPEFHFGKEQAKASIPEGAVMFHMGLKDEFDQWKLEKRIKLEKDFAITPIYYHPSGNPYDGTNIRKLILEEGNWQQYVPDTTRSIIEKNINEIKRKLRH